MSKPCVTIDYFSHDWDALDLGCASQELGRQIADLRRKLMHVDNKIEKQQDVLRQYGRKQKSTSHTLQLLSKEKHRMLSDEFRLSRLHNVAWRQFMATKPNAPKIDPIAINWQKASDVIWLYGPLFRRDETDVHFEKRHGCPELFTGSAPQQQQPSSASPTTVKSALKKRQETKQDYVARLLGKSVLKRYKRRSFPVDRAMEFDVDTTMAALEEYSRKTGRKETRFKPNVLEYIYHPELPIQGRRSPPPSAPPSDKRSATTLSSRSEQSCPAHVVAPVIESGPAKQTKDTRSSAACQRAKALLLAARSQPKTSVAHPPYKSTCSPVTPPHSPSKDIEIRFNPDDADSHRIPPKPAKKQSWFWPFFSSESSQPPTQPPAPSTQKTESSIPNLCANLISLSAEMVTLMGTAALYKGVGYGLGCSSSQQKSGVYWTRY